MIKSEVAWWNGKLQPFADTNVHITTHTLHYGLGVFEGIRCYQRKDGTSSIFRLREHIERLHDSAKICMMKIPFTVEQICQACVDVVKANKLPAAYLRPLAFLGCEALGLGCRDNPTEVTVICWSWGTYLGDEAMKRGTRVRISSFTRDIPNATMSKGKICGQYVNSILGKREAQDTGYDEAIFLDATGRVCEAAGENIFVVSKGRIYTPPLAMPILAGITRDSVITLAQEAKMDLTEQTFTRDFLYTADEVFFTGTAAEVTPVREIDGRTVGKGEPGPITKQLQAAYFDAVHGVTHPEWHTAVK